METVFDYNITDAERENLGILEKTKEEHVKLLDDDSSNWYLALLFHSRGDDCKFKKYADKLPDLMKYDCYRTATHP